MKLSNERVKQAVKSSNKQIVVFKKNYCMFILFLNKLEYKRSIFHYLFDILNSQLQNYFAVNAFIEDMFLKIYLKI